MIRILQNILKAGNNRPYIPEELRAINLSVLDMVDYVIIDQNAKPIKNINIIKPDYFAKGSDYVTDGLNSKTLEEKKLVESYGGEIIFTPGDIVYSSTSIISQKPPALKYEKLKILLDAEGINFKSLYDVLNTKKKGSFGFRRHNCGFIYTN